MGNTYRITGRVGLLDWQPGDTFEHEFTADVEADMLAAGRIQIVPRAYRVVGTSRVLDTDPGGEFVAALTVTQEAQLVAGGHIQRARPPEKPPQSRKGGRTAPDPTTTDEHERKE